MTSIKFADSGEIAGWGAPFGDPAHKDSDGEYFSRRTDFGLDLIPTGRPLLIGHGLGEAGPAVVGRITSVVPRPEGLWITAQLDRAGRYFGKIRDQLAAGVLAFSSATMAHLARTAPDGEILSWPLVEVSLTDRPSNRDARIVSVKNAVAHFAEIGQPPSALKSLVLGPGAAEEEDFILAMVKVDRIETRRAGAEAEAEFAAIAAKMDRRFAQRGRRT
jgi:hypothetical protein